jgi:hypothetical protein
MFSLLAVMTLRGKESRRSIEIPWYVITLFFILAIGFRDCVGCDWESYIAYYERLDTATLGEALQQSDPAHQFFNWWMNQWGLGVYGVNLIYATVFMIGLVKFSRMQLYPWLAMAVATPYLIVVVVMGYSRQGVAIGLFMWALTYLLKGKFKAYMFFMIFAALIHKTALIMIPLGIVLYGKGLLVRLLMVVPIVLGVVVYILSGELDYMWSGYIEEQMQSGGAKVRVLMNFIPALILFYYRKEWKRQFSDYAIWFWIALGSIFAMAVVGLASTAVDRVSLYFIPIQLVVFSRLPYLARRIVAPQVTIYTILFAYASVLFVWLNYATHSFCWVPYKNIIISDLW